MSLLHSETTNFSKEVESSMLCLGTPYQYGDFHAIMDSSEFNNNSYRNQVISLQGSSSSKTPEVKISRSTNYNGEGDDRITKQIKVNPQISDDDDQQHNLTLNLF
ncbi:uncharacterized protein [Medicago truncatula]|nr:uncharacterized protein LOC120579436 [Medicago truncatula]